MGNIICYFHYFSFYLLKKNCLSVFFSLGLEWHTRTGHPSSINQHGRKPPETTYLIVTCAVAVYAVRFKQLLRSLTNHRDSEEETCKKDMQNLQFSVLFRLYCLVKTYYFVIEYWKFWISNWSRGNLIDFRQFTKTR